MTNLEIILICIIYIILSFVVYRKQYDISIENDIDSGAQGYAAFAAIFAPITLVLYMFRAAFFEDWV